MVLKPDQQHIKDLLSETITLLCCNGLIFRSEFSIDALIGITLDKDEVFLVSIKETFRNDETGVCSKQKPKSEKDSGNGSASLNSDTTSRAIDHASANRFANCGMEIGEDRAKAAESIQQNSVQHCHGRTLKHSTGKRKNKMPMKYGLKKNDSFAKPAFENKLYEREAVKRLRLDLSSDSGGVAINPDFSNSESHGAICLENTSAAAGGMSGSSGESARISAEGDIESNTVQDTGEAFERENWHDGSDEELVFIKEEPSCEKSLVPVRQCSEAYAEFAQRSRVTSASDLVHPSMFVKLDDSAGCSSWNFLGSSAGLQMPVSSRQRWQLEPVKSQQPSEAKVESLSPENLSHLSDDELSVARAILSMRGNFVSLGCLKANRQSLRIYTREHLIAIMQRMSSPVDRSLFIGLLYTIGTSHIFFKCPPSQVTQTAVKYFGFNLLAYNECFYKPVVVDKNIRDPEAWVAKILDRSPFRGGNTSE